MSKVNSSDLAEELSEKMRLSRTVARNCVDLIFDSILNHVEQGDEVSIKRFGKFQMRVAAPRVGRNLHTGESVSVSGRYRLKFEMSRTLAAAYDRSSSAEGFADDDKTQE